LRAYDGERRKITFEKEDFHGGKMEAGRKRGHAKRPFVGRDLVVEGKVEP
jgi:hypothetical protein